MIVLVAGPQQQHSPTSGPNPVQTRWSNPVQTRWPKYQDHRSSWCTAAPTATLTRLFCEYRLFGHKKTSLLFCYTLLPVTNCTTLLPSWESFTDPPPPTHYPTSYRGVSMWIIEENKTDRETRQTSGVQTVGKHPGGGERYVWYDAEVIEYSQSVALLVCMVREGPYAKALTRVTYTRADYQRHIYK